MSRLAVSLSLVFLACTPTESPDGKPGDAKKDDSNKHARPRMCTDMGCSDNGVIETKLTSAGAPLGKHEFAIEVDGKPQTCSLEFTDVASTVFATCDTPGTTLSFGPVTTGKEERLGEVVAYTEVPVPGQFRWQLGVEGTPAKIHVVHSQGSNTILDQTAELTKYEEWRPNGEGCEPVCKTQRLEWKGP